jgi:hypothetical protein
MALMMTNYLGYLMAKNMGFYWASWMEIWQLAEDMGHVSRHSY